MRSTIIFGNGLGMAIRPDIFSLNDCANKAMLSKDYSLSYDKLELIKACLPQSNTLDSFDFSEENMKELQEILFCCRRINGIETNTSVSCGWLNEHGKKFDEYMREFSFNIARYLVEYAVPVSQTRFFDEKYNAFEISLSEYIKASHSHLATLNYDTILYDMACRNNLFKGKKCLFDGLIKGKPFSNGSILRPDALKSSYYLHLHGSPLFYQNSKGEVYKYDRKDLKELQFSVEQANGNFCGSFLVLAPPEHKSAIINSSPLLLKYWHCLAEAIQESDCVVIVGCSGEDKHLNDYITTTINKKTNVYIVEWNGNSHDFNYWRDMYNSNNVKLFHYPKKSIFDFDFSILY